MPRILIIEDDDTQRYVFKKVLTESGYEVVEASNGEEGMRLYRQQPCELVITDIYMPEKEGLETIIELREDYPDIKIIAISGGGALLESDTLQVARHFGADDTLDKPIKNQSLLNAVEKLDIFPA